VTNIDLAATIADAAGVRPGLTVDGRSMLPYARRPETRTARPLLHEAGEGALRTVLDNRPGSQDPAGRGAAQGDLDQDGLTSQRPQPKGQITSVAYEAIRTERYLYIRIKSGERELYDYKTDPYELSSVHDDPRYAQVRDQVDRHLDDLQGCQGTACSASIPPVPEPG
jgi:arylsulfatase A-like enzyme